MLLRGVQSCRSADRPGRRRRRRRRQVSSAELATVGRLDRNVSDRDVDRVEVPLEPVALAAWILAWYPRPTCRRREVEDRRLLLLRLRLPGERRRVRGPPEVGRPEVEDRPVDGDLPEVDVPVVVAVLPGVAVRPAEGEPVAVEAVLAVVGPEPAELLLRRRRRED